MNFQWAQNWLFPPEAVSPTPWTELICMSTDKTVWLSITTTSRALGRQTNPTGSNLPSKGPHSNVQGCKRREGAVKFRRKGGWDQVMVQRVMKSQVLSRETLGF